MTHSDEKTGFRGIHIIPNLFTSANLFCGFYALVAAVEGRFTRAAAAVVAAVVFDILDGKIARATNSTSRFGLEYDSLADVVSFGIAPGMLMYLWVLEPIGRVAWSGVFLFMICGALRLARFNVQAQTKTGGYFTGLPIPAAAGMVAAVILFCRRYGITVNPYILLTLMYFSALLMVSNIRYKSFKRIAVSGKIGRVTLLLLPILVGLLAAAPALTLFVAAVLYVAAGPVFAVIRMIAGEDSDDPDDPMEEDLTDLEDAGEESHLTI
jgi:CDP-diacylglycerol--serine O-phosphatidyltransferase